MHQLLKYKGILTYRQLCDDTFKKKYVEWCINESVIHNGVKERLRYFAEKCKDFKKSTILRVV
jgi:hypothetical protein